MRFLRSARWLLLALLVFLIPVPSHAGVFISVGVAPPPLPVMAIADQPPCPEPGWMWQPGYWAYDYDAASYYWVPGTWVPAPYEGALWTPGYWGWGGGVYAWHPGYWGPHIGYYGGVNYGFGYFGIGFVGGAWHGGVFAYNTAVLRVNTTVIHNVYVNRDYTRNVVVNNHVAFVGGPGGIRHDPTSEERIADHDQHVGPTSFQTQHAQAAMHNPGSFYNNNHGHPANIAAPRPMTFNGGAHGNPNPQPAARSNPQYQQHAQPQMQQHAQPQPQYQRAQPQAQRAQPQAQQRPQPQQSHPQPQSRPQSHPQDHQQPHNDDHDHGK